MSHPRSWDRYDASSEDRSKQWKLKRLKEQITQMRQEREDNMFTHNILPRAQRSTSPAYTSPPPDVVAASSAATISLRKVVGALEEENRLLKVQLDSKSQTIKDLEELLKTQQRENEDTEKWKSHHQTIVEDKLRQKDVELAKVQRELQAAEQLKKECQETVALMQSFVDEKDNTIKLLKTRREEDATHRDVLLKQEADAHEHKAAKLNRILDERMLELEGARREISRLKQSLRDLKRGAQLQADELKAQTAEAVNKTSESLQLELDSAHLEIGKLQEGQVFLEQEHERDLARARAEYEQMLERKTFDLQDALKGLQTNLEEEKKQRAAEEVARHELEAKLAKQKTQLEEASEHTVLLTESDAKIEKLQKNFEKEISRVEAQLQKIESERDEALAQLAAEKESLSNYAATEDHLRHDLAGIQQSNDVLKVEMAELEDTVTKLGEELDSKTELLKEASRDRTALQLQVREAEEQVEAHKRELEQALLIGNELQHTTDLMHQSQQRAEERRQQKEAVLEKQAVRVRQQEQQLQDAVTKMHVLQREAEDREEVVSKLQGMLEAQQKILDDAGAAHHLKERQHRETIARLQAEVRDALAEKADVAQQVKLVQQDLVAAREQVVIMKRQVSDLPGLAAANTELQRKVEELEDRVACEGDSAKSVQRLVGEKDEAVQAANAKLRTTKGQLEEAKVELESCNAARDVIVSLLTGNAQLSRDHDQVAVFNAMDFPSLAAQAALRVDELSVQYEALTVLSGYLTDLRASIVLDWAHLPLEAAEELQKHESPLEDEEAESAASDTRGVEADPAPEDRRGFKVAAVSLKRALRHLTSASAVSGRIASLEAENKALEDLVEARSDWKETFVTETREALISGVASSFRHVSDAVKAIATAKRRLRTAKEQAPPELEDAAAVVALVKATVTKVISGCFTDREKASHGFNSSTFSRSEPGARKKSTGSSVGGRRTSSVV